DYAGEHGKDILDAMAEFLGNQFALFGRQLGLVDVGAGPEPADDAPFGVTDRQGQAQRPAIVATMVPQAIFDMVRLTGFERPLPHFPGALLVVGMEYAIPAVAVGGALRLAGEVVPALVEIVVLSIGRGGPDHLRHGVRQGAEPQFAFDESIGNAALLGDVHHDARQADGRALPVETRPARSDDPVDGSIGANEPIFAAERGAFAQRG